MKTVAYLNKIEGIDDALVSLRMSKQSIDRDGEINIRKLCESVFDRRGNFNPDAYVDQVERINEMIDKLCFYGKKHITLLKFIDLSVTVYGLHRGGCDDLDSHAKRMDNRIVRSSTRLSTKHMDEVSEWYEDKIIPTDAAFAIMGVKTPEYIVLNGAKYVKAINGYIREDMKDSNDAKRGLYMLSIPTRFIFKINLAEFAHVLQLRDKNGGASPELQIVIEQILAQLTAMIPQFNREFLYEMQVNI